MRKIYLILGYIVLLTVSCKKYDEIALWNMANNQEQRLTALEELCSQMNTNIEAVQTIVSVSQNGDYIVNVSPVMKNGIEIGYTITFAKSGTITIYHGINGNDGENGEGTIPIVGLKQDTDGIYYWILNGEWLLDDKGNKVKASGTDGKDGKSAYELAVEKGYSGTLDEWLETLKNGSGSNGKSAYELAVEKGYTGTEAEWLESLKGTNGQDGKTPKLKIENGRWMLSMDGGNTWEDIGQATGDKGEVIFQKVDCSTDNDYVIFTLVDGTEFKLPKYVNESSGSNGQLSITFSETTDILVEPLVDYDITYSITGADANTTIEAIGIDGFEAIVTPSSISTGTITVTPAWKNENKSVVIIVRDGEQISILKKLTFRYDDEHMYIIIPDPIKEDFLPSYDRDCNGEISYAEALNFTELTLTPERFSTSIDIYSLEWIQYFTNLTSLNLNGQHLTKLDLSKNVKLTTLDCECNKLSFLDVSNCTALTYLKCSSNKLTSSALNKIFEDLPQVERGYIYISFNPGDDTCDKSIAENKGWIINPR